MLISPLKLTFLSVDGLVCIRGGRTVFRDISFHVEAGEALSLEGPNGAGKTSLLRMIAGFLSPAAGTIRLQMKDGEISDGEERGRFIGWLGHNDAAKPQFSPRETLLFFVNLYCASGDIDEALHKVGLGKVRDLPCQYLSAGQKKRLVLARLMLTTRPLWLLDEPFAALDAEGKALAASLIATHCNGGGIVLVATHEPLGVEGRRFSLATQPTV